VLGGLEVALEAGFAAGARDELHRRGHRIIDDAPDADFAFGGAQLILLDQASGIYTAASDHRKDGMAAGF